MKFVDEVKIRIKAGDGGDGAVAFRREKFIEKGGPSGGDGGDGGSIVFRVDPRMSTLLDYRFLSQHQAKSGGNGMGSDCNGKKGETLVLRVPPGTLIKDADNGHLLGDLSTPQAELLVARGGKGGRGNMHFATSTRQTPRFAEEGKPGEERNLCLELKLLADVGIVGFPNVGKSLLISKISRSTPKVADYPFTTLVPNLGVVAYKNHLSFVVADIPGLVEGASEGIGLGLRFLKHVERCKVLIHLLDASGHAEGRNMEADYGVLCGELKKFSPSLAKKPQLLVANKVDIPTAKEAYAAFAKHMKKKRKHVFPMSALTGEGIGAVVDAAAQKLFSKPTATPKRAKKERG
ncbi:MAG: GTPase ObgE [Cystobacterineae bacterium]|nr:GTPase ObgE [Cystobacterineae bacterium]